MGQNDTDQSGPTAHYFSTQAVGLQHARAYKAIKSIYLNYRKEEMQVFTIRINHCAVYVKGVQCRFPLLTKQLYYKK